jgi:hypothetical protein
MSTHIAHGDRYPASSLYPGIGEFPFVMIFCRGFSLTKRESADLEVQPILPRTLQRAAKSLSSHRSGTSHVLI